MKRFISVISALFLLLGVRLVVENASPPTTLGLDDGKLAPLPDTPNAISSQTDDSSRRVTAFPFRENMELTQICLKKAIAAYGSYHFVTEDPTYWHVVFSTKIGFKDDVEFYFDQNSGLVQFRSASRSGYSDMGLNRKRYNALFSSYAQCSIH